MHNLETPRSFEDFIRTQRQAADNFELALKLKWFDKSEFAERWKITVRETYAMILANNLNGTVKLPDGYEANTIDGEPQLDYAINIFNNLNDYLGKNIMWLALEPAIEGKKEYEFIYKYYDFILNDEYEFGKEEQA
jgi:hypothetical protein